jgi:hypothetical protein
MSLTEMGCRRHVRVPPISNRTADVAGGPVRVQPRASVETQIQSFWQACQPQTFFQPFEIVGSAKRDPILDCGNAPCRVKLAQARHGLLCLRKPPDKRIGRRQFANGCQIGRTLPQRRFCPRDRFPVPACEKVSESDPAFRPEAMRIQRRELYCVGKLGDRAFGITEKSLGPSTRKQGPSKVRIECERPLDEEGPSSRSWATKTSAYPPPDKATASSGPSSTARRPSPSASAISLAGSTIQPFTLRQWKHIAAKPYADAKPRSSSMAR